MRAGLVSSTVLHGGILAFMLFSFSSAKPFDAMQESMPVDIVSNDELSQMMAGKKDAAKAETPKQVVEKVAPEPKPAENLDDPISDKPEVKAANEPPPPPPAPKPPEPKPPEPKVVEAPPAPPKPEPKPPEAKPAPTPPKPPDEDALKTKPPEPKKEDPKPEQKVAQVPEKPAPTPPKKPPPPKPVVQAPPRDQQQDRKFDSNQIAALLDKRTPSRQASIGATINNTAALGATTGSAARLSQTEIDALRARLMSLWNPPAGASNPEELIVTVRIRLNQDGTLAAPPQVMTSGGSSFFMSARESAIRAIFRGQPFDMLSPSKYDSWKDIEITFDPRDMFRG
ncbi:TonB C-terminal domain-containing protein [Ancylobacter sp. 6x-1]|uniref:TonB C-terminal domain-containing protein n=1 Tax=Ancylobacter crimeensis TaxID=2579147 RepID=A0ABT0DEG5_9HYPH|nr:TonB C-terminal domain-containing protein [Ancylobacter crimeensis]MCK0198336.1 TonB C-terminal domain-containing protein [Ancylobacter crimeensis]